MKILKRIVGICETKLPEKQDCWRYSGGRVEVELSKTPEFNEKGAAIRLEGKGLPKRLLIVCNGNDAYHAFENRCTHFGRRLDPLPGQSLIQCCSIGRSTFDYSGTAVSGPGKGTVKTFPVEQHNGVLIVSLD